MTSPAPSTRPPWARRLDRAALLAGRALRLLLPRPDEGRLDALARRDRPAPDLPADPTGPLEAGRRAFELGRWGEALHHFGQVLAADPEHAWGWHGRGDALQLLGDPAGALDAYDHAVALDPETGLHHGGRANALQALGRPGAAKEAWHTALSLDPAIAWMRGYPERG